MLKDPKPFVLLQNEYSESVKSAITYALERHDTLELGRFTIPESEIYGIKLIYNLKSLPESLVYERHRTHIDLHLIIRGAEYISQLNELNGQQLDTYNAIDDYELYSSSEQNLIFFNEGQALVFDHDTWHATGFGAENISVEKIVLKIPNHVI